MKYLIFLCFIIVIFIALVPKKVSEKFTNFFDKIFTPDIIPINNIPAEDDCQIEWQPWEACSVPCDGQGTQRRIGMITRKEKPYGIPCPISDNSIVIETIPCDLGICPDTCVYGQWSDMTVCDAKCGIGSKLQKRDTNLVSCKDTKQVVACAGPALGLWLNKGDCILPKNKVCGTCTQHQVRTLPNKKCTANSTQNIKNNIPCPPCIYTDWINKDGCIINTNMCPKSNINQEPLYQSGYQFQTRNIDTSTLPGAICDLPLVRSNVCQYPCPINCAFSPNWVTNNICKIEDNTNPNNGTGYMLYTKPIIHKEKYGGTCDPLNPNYKEYKPCSNAFPQDCRYSEWSNVGACTIACQYNHDGPNGTSVPWETHRGIQQQQRTIISVPTKGGTECTGSLIQYMPCDDYVPCPIDCKYNDNGWYVDGNCLPMSGQCGPGWQKMSRAPINLSRYGGGCDSIQTKSNKCIVPC